MAERVQWTTSRIIGSPDPAPPYELRRVFQQFTFENPVFIAQDPLSDRLLVAEYGGRIYSIFGSDPAGKKDLFLDMKRRISAFSFHPQYRDNRQVFVFSPTETPRSRTRRTRRTRRRGLSRSAASPALSSSPAAIPYDCSRSPRPSSSNGQRVAIMAAKQ